MTDSGTNNGAVKYDKGDDGIVVLTLDDPTSSTNTMNELYKESMASAIDRLYAEKEDVTGVVITSAKKTFFAGGDLKAMLKATPEDAQAIFETVESIKADLRRLEQLGKPVVAAINGAALGGGLEIALACHHRIVVDDDKVELGLPEVTLGLLPGGGGVTRTVRMLGIQSALMDVLLQGPRFKPAQPEEKRYLAELVTGSNSKNMIQAFFFDLSAINGGSLRPEGIAKFTATKVGVLGAGMMGAGIAYSCARAGMEVVLKDVSQESADKGKAYSENILTKAVERGKMDEARKAEILDRITASTEPTDLKGCDLVIEAVFEDPSLKAQVFGEIQDIVNADALLCSNTSTLPITELAEGVNRPDDFVGLHFFSPVDKMPLVEIIRGAKTTDALSLIHI